MRLKCVKVRSLGNGSVQVTPGYYAKGGKTLFRQRDSVYAADVELAMKGLFETSLMHRLAKELEDKSDNS